MTIAFVLQTHTGLEQIARLCEALNRGLDDKIIVISHNGPLDECGWLESRPGVDRVLPAPGGRAQFSLLDGLFSALRWLESQAQPYEWICVLSGQDYPIRPLNEFEDRLKSSPFDGIFHYFDAENPPELPPHLVAWTRQETETRYLFHAVQLKRNLGILDRALWKLPRHCFDLTGNYRLHTGFGLNFCRRAAPSPFGPDFKLYGSSNWLTVRRRCVQILLRFVDERPDLTDHFRRTISPEEAFPATVLANDCTVKLSDEELRYYDFSKTQDNRPATITRDMLRQVYESGKYFARKFDMYAHPGIIDEVDRHIGHLEAGGAQRLPA